MEIIGGANTFPAISLHYHYQWHKENGKCWEFNLRPEDKTLSTNKTVLPGKIDYFQWNVCAIGSSWCFLSYDGAWKSGAFLRREA